VSIDRRDFLRAATAGAGLALGGAGVSPVEARDMNGPANSRATSGGGSAEAFKQGPVLGEYIAGRVLGTETDQELIEGFRLKAEEFVEDERRGP